jgi:RimJ/RimL family protein N-acetyltransferase
MGKQRPLPADIRVEDYGVVLTRLTVDDLEMVRRWRTSPEINQFMLYREPITPEMQRQWYASLDPERDLHFVIHWGGVPCGLSDLKRIDWEAGTNVGGIFMTPEHWHTDVPMRVTFAATDYAFHQLGLQATLCSVRKTNTRAIRFNLAVGYHILNTEPDDPGLAYEMRMDRDDYERATRRLRDYLRKTAAVSR